MTQWISIWYSGLGSLLLLISSCHRPVQPTTSTTATDDEPMGVVTDSLRTVWNKQTKGLKVYGQEEFWYQWFGENPQATKPQIGEQVRIDYTIQKGDSILDHSYATRNPILVQIPEPRYDNFFTKALQLMGTGDSICLLVPARDIPQLLGQHVTSFTADDLVTFTYKLYEIKDPATLQQEIMAEQKRLDSIRQTIPTLMQEFEQGTLMDLKTTERGLSYLIFDQGKNKRAQQGNPVTVHYICFSDAGLIVDDSYTNMVPLPFVVGSQTLIEGLSQGVELLGEGGTALLFIPPNLAYGVQGYGEVIPPNSWVTFYIELMDIENN
ncbi:MAG: FKBP-type peptidyl-prolyl cis-trans isomerase [Aureispira sp.]